MNRLERVALAALAVSLLALPSAALAGPEWTHVPLDAATLDLEGAETARFEQRGERRVLCLDGKAFVRGLDLAEGSIAVDIANERSRHFANIVFRASGPEDYETAYLRMHKSRQADAMQYTPTFNGETNWQLFADAQASADYGAGDWVTLRVDFAGSRVRVSMVRDGAEQAAFTTDLAHPASHSGVGIRTLFEGCFSNLRYARAVPAIPADEGATGEPRLEGAVMRWSLSPAFAMEAWAGLSETLRVAGDWQAVASEPDGMLLISRHRRKRSAGRFERNGLDGVYAGLAVHSDRARSVDLAIDASDMATVFLNGEAIHAFDNSFRAKGPLFRGEVDAARQVLRLPLRKGRNELFVLVAEQANGWGLSAAIEPVEGVRVTPVGEED